jgi:hypothetical protein
MQRAMLASISSKIDRLFDAMAIDGYDGDYIRIKGFNLSM